MWVICMLNLKLLTGLKYLIWLQGGMGEEEARKEASLIKEAQEMLRKWEADDPAVTYLWKMMNGWVYEGFDVTYQRMGVLSTGYIMNRRLTIPASQLWRRG
jgi:hypothetical protein